MAYQLPPWLQITPTLQLQAAQAGTNAGLSVAQMRQQAAMAELQSQERAAAQAAEERLLLQRLQGDQVRQALDRELQDKKLAADASQFEREMDLNQRRLASSDAIGRMNAAIGQSRLNASGVPQSVEELTLPDGTLVGYGFGKNVKWVNPGAGETTEVKAPSGELLGYDRNGRFISLPKKSFAQEMIAAAAGTNAPPNFPAAPMPSTSSVTNRFRLVR